MILLARRQFSSVGVAQAVGRAAANQFLKTMVFNLKFIALNSLSTHILPRRIGF